MTSKSKTISDAGARVLVVEPDRKHLRSITRILRTLVGSVEGRQALEGELDVDTFDLLVINYDALADAERKSILDRARVDSRRGAHLLFVSGGKARDDFVDLFSSRTLTNLVAKNDDQIDAEALIVTTAKILRRDIFGLEKYFIWGVRPIEMKIRSTDEKDIVVEAAERYATSLRVGKRFVSQFCAVADEFVTNALYNAPTSPDGSYRFAHKPRSERIALDPGEEVIVKFCCDGHRLGISTSDPFGSLAAEQILDYLGKCLRQGADQIDEKQGGAGLGFYYIFDALSHFIVNIHPLHRTEMVGIIDVRGSYRDFYSRPKSFNIFLAGSRDA